MTPEDKVKEYIERAKEILYEKFPHGDNYGIQITDGEFLNSLLGIAQMLQREEHFNQGQTEITGGFDVALQEEGRLEAEHFNSNKE